MTTRAARRAEAAEREAEQPFSDEITPREAQSLAVQLAQGYAEDAQVTTYAPGEGGVPIQVSPEALVNQAFMITGVRLQPVVSDYETGEIAYELCLVAGQAVKLDASLKVTRRGRVVVFIAGRVDSDNPERSSVLGREMQELLLMREPTPSTPVLVPNGIRKVGTQAGGHYFTLRPEAPKSADLFPD